MNHKFLLIICSIILLTLIITNVSAITPTGATTTPGTSTSTPTGTAGNISAIAGNITAVNIFSGNSVTQVWQGYYGNVSGGLRIADSNDKALYNWSLSTPSGEVYSSVNSSVTWNNIQCFNFTAIGNYSNESGMGGTTNLYGTNLTQLHDEYNINDSDLDSVNSTFNSKNHDAFFTANKEFVENECQSLQLFTNTSAGQDGLFEEVILYEPETASIVFTSILEVASKGFNNVLVDFEMLVLDDGHGVDVDVTTYYFFLELE
ncbi:hypothetical protein GOV12_06915 [Candidatus Pacearchaeota archaeon]|nr:hypothetical protein [Candidatus Pacearchaeota archaeon]